VLVDKDEARNPLLLLHSTVVAQGEKNTETIYNLIKKIVLPTWGKKIKIEYPHAQSNGVTALPCNRRFAATHLLFCPRTFND